MAQDFHHGVRVQEIKKAPAQLPPSARPLLGWSVPVMTPTRKHSR